MNEPNACPKRRAGLATGTAFDSYGPAPDDPAQTIFPHALHAPEECQRIDRNAGERHRRLRETRAVARVGARQSAACSACSE